MAGQKLPQPVTNAESYLYALVAELQTLNRMTAALLTLMTPPADDETPETELREPEPKPAHRDAKRASTTRTTRKTKA